MKYSRRDLSLLVVLVGREWREIIGVVEDGKYRSLGEAPMPAAFEPYAQVWTPETTIVARSPLPEEQVVGMLRRAVAELDPGIAIYGAGSLTEQLGLVLFPARIAATVLGAFGLLAVVLAATGVYGAAPTFEPSREVKNKMGIPRPGLVQLQAADFLAYELRKHRREAADRTARPVRRSFYEILKVPVMFMGALNDKNAAILCEVENVPKR